MRLHLEDKTALPKYRNEIRATCEWVARQFPRVKGTKTVIIRKVGATKQHEHHGQYCGRVVKCFVNFSEAAPYPKTVTERNYFKHANGKPNPYTLHNWQESLVHILSHELAHGMKSNRRMRRSRQELDSENRATEVLELYRNAKLEIELRRVELAQQAADNKTRQLELRAPASKIVSLLARQKQWETKRKRAETALKKIAKSLKYYQGKEALPTAPHLR